MDQGKFVNSGSYGRADEEQGRGKATGKNRKGSEAIAAYCFLAVIVLVVGFIVWNLIF